MSENSDYTVDCGHTIDDVQIDDNGKVTSSLKGQEPEEAESTPSPTLPPTCLAMWEQGVLLLRCRSTVKRGFRLG